MTSESFVHPYIPNTAPASRAAMLAAVGAASVDEFYADIPASLRLNRPLDLPAPLVAEQDLARHVRGILAKNTPTGERLPHPVPATSVAATPSPSIRGSASALWCSKRGPISSCFFGRASQVCRPERRGPSGRSLSGVRSE